jgi:hypothetical protein
VKLKSILITFNLPTDITEDELESMKHQFEPIQRRMMTSDKRTYSATFEYFAEAIPEYPVKWTLMKRFRFLLGRT